MYIFDVTFLFPFGSQQHPAHSYGSSLSTRCMVHLNFKHRFITCTARYHINYNKQNRIKEFMRKVLKYMYEYQIITLLFDRRRHALKQI